MDFFHRISRSNFFIKLRHWEYWPFGILQFPAIMYYGWLSVRARSFFFFTASNPGIEMGGMFGESKYAVLKRIPEKYCAQTIFISCNTKAEEVFKKMRAAGLHFPVVFKPDLGERGYRVKIIYNEKEATDYIMSFKFDFLVQELVDLPLEFGVFYKRLPSQATGSVFSIVGKEMLTVTGNGSATLQELIFFKDRAKLQWGNMKEKHQSRLTEIIPRGEIVVLNSIGNHCLGTTFLDKNSLINSILINSFDKLAKQIDGFYYGRFDLRCSSIEDLNAGLVKILELNGCGAEPAHIYQPGYSFLKAVKEVLNHWKNIFDIAMENKERGIRFLSYKEAKLYYQKFKHAVQP